MISLLFIVLAACIVQAEVDFVGENAKLREANRVLTQALKELALGEAAGDEASVGVTSGEISAFGKRNWKSQSRKIGQSCFFVQDCIPGLKCRKPMGTTWTTEGVCEVSASGSDAWYSGWCEYSSGVDANGEMVSLGKGYNQDSCLRKCQEDPSFVACEFYKKKKGMCYRHMGDKKILYASGAKNYSCYIRYDGGVTYELSYECEDCAIKLLDSGVCPDLKAYSETKQGNPARIIQRHMPDECGQIRKCTDDRKTFFGQLCGTEF